MLNFLCGDPTVGDRENSLLFWTSLLHCRIHSSENLIWDERSERRGGQQSSRCCSPDSWTRVLELLTQRNFRQRWPFYICICFRHSTPHCKWIRGERFEERVSTLFLDLSEKKIVVDTGTGSAWILQVWIILRLICGSGSSYYPLWRMVSLHCSVLKNNSLYM